MRVARVAAPLLLLAVAVARAQSPALPLPPAEWFLDQVKTLSAPENEGRQAGTPGAERAARQVADELRSAGVAPGGDGGTYFQAFSVPTEVQLGPANALELVAPAALARPLALGSDFAPLAVSENGEWDGEVVFAGYGITASGLGYDDYAGLDVRDRVVLVLEGEPRRADPASPFRQPEVFHYSQRSHKIINAREHGARAILVASHPATGDEELPALSGISQPWAIVSLYVRRGVAELLLGAAGRRLGDVADLIDRTLGPQSFPLPGVRMRLRVDLVRQRSATANVVGILRGSDPRLAGEAIVIGAHYDHLGHGGEGSLAPDQKGIVHPGADDNASGTAAVIGLARAFARTGGSPRTLVFVAFAGEEMGLLGSQHYVKHPAHPMDRTVLMVNFDMVGRLVGGKLYVGGVDSGTGLRTLTAAAGHDVGLAPELRGSPFAPSDHTTFVTAGRPVLFLFTGAHPDYHRPSDTWEKINAEGIRTVATFAARVVASVAAEPTPPAYVKVTEPPAESGPRAQGYGPFFGVVPEFGESEQEGVTISGVRPGSPADQAGVRAGDVLVTFGGVRVRTLQDFVFALRGRRAGDRVDLSVRRDGTQQHLEAVLQERR